MKVHLHVLKRSIRGQSSLKWRKRVLKYVWERGDKSLRNFNQARRECGGSSWEQVSRVNSVMIQFVTVYLLP